MDILGLRHPRKPKPRDTTSMRVGRVKQRPCPIARPDPHVHHITKNFQRPQPSSQMRSCPDVRFDPLHFSSSLLFTFTHFLAIYRTVPAPLTRQCFVRMLHPIHAPPQTDNEALLAYCNVEVFLNAITEVENRGYDLSASLSTYEHASLGQ